MLRLNILFSTVNIHPVGGSPYLTLSFLVNYDHLLTFHPFTFSTYQSTSPPVYMSYLSVPAARPLWRFFVQPNYEWWYHSLTQATSSFLLSVAPAPLKLSTVSTRRVVTIEVASVCSGMGGGAHGGRERLSGRERKWIRVGWTRVWGSRLQPHRLLR